jgi:tetratricopeptide (TPR) repeat protein
MPRNPNKFSQFWQELKRRKVIKVIAMYAATAFIIMEAADIMLPRLGLPDWTVTFLIILLIVGFPITIILSWIFDITPEGVRKTESIEVTKEQEPSSVPVKRKLKASDVIIAVLVVVVVILAYPKIFGSGKSKIVKDPDGKISITVLPFENLTGDSLYYDWQAGIQNLLINSLANSKEISVRQPETMSNILSGIGKINYASITPSIGSEIALKLETNTFILGNILKAGTKIRISAQLRDASTQEIFRSYEVDGDSEDQIFKMADSLSNLLINFLEISVLEQDAYLFAKTHSETKSAEAYKYYIQGIQMGYSAEFAEAIKLYNKALDRDSGFVSALVWLTVSYLNNGQPDQARLIQERTEKHIEEAPLYERLYYYFFKAILDKDIQGCIKYALRLTKEYPHSINTYYSLGWSYTASHQFEKAASTFNQLFERMRQMNLYWPYSGVYNYAGQCYHALGQHTKEMEVYKYGLLALPDYPEIIWRQVLCSITQGDTIKANNLLSRYQSSCEEQGYSVSRSEANIGLLYEKAEYPRKAEKHYQLAIEYKPTDTYTIWAMNELAYLLINIGLSISEGISLIDQALETNPTDMRLLASIYHTKGWGLHKQGKNREALEHLYKAWDLRPFYDHDHFLHIQEVEKALASQNN